MVSQKLIRQHSQFLFSLYKAKTQQSLEQCLVNASLAPLRTLISLIRDIILQKIPLQKPNEKRKLMKHQGELRLIVDQPQREFRSKSREDLLECLRPLLKIIKVVLKPIFEDRSPSVEENTKAATPEESSAVTFPTVNCEHCLNHKESEEELEEIGDKSSSSP